MSLPLTTLRESSKPSAAVKARIYKRIQSRIDPAAYVCREVHPSLVPAQAAKTRVWARIANRIQAEKALSLLEQLRDLLQPPAGLRAQLAARILPRLQPVFVSARAHHMFKWTAAFAVLALAVRLTPFVILATPTVAESAVTLIPTRGGDVSVSIGGLWQPVTGEVALEPGTILRTRDSEATILFHDDGVLRLGANTTVALNDTAKRLGPQAPDVMPTFTLYDGRIWVQGLIPANVRGLTVSTSYGHVTVNEGSVSVSEDEIVDVQVFDHRAAVQHNGDDVVLIAGERTELWDGNIPLVKKISQAGYEDQWSVQNLARDAVHRREIAQLQQERRAATAGILPTSKFYSVKRVAEAVDVIFTFGQDARMQKRLTHANTRLSEAAALLARDQAADAAAPLAEYREVLLALAGDSEEDTLIHFLLEQSLSDASADMAAALPNDEMYLLKQAVLEASAEVDGLVRVEDIQGVLIMDSLVSLIQAVQSGEVAGVQKAWIDLQPHLVLLEQEDVVLQADVHKEILALLARFALVVQDHEAQIASIDPELVGQVMAYLPKVDKETVPAMTEEEVQILVQSIRDRIFVYHLKQSRLNQLVAELKAIEGHPEQGRILRRLYFVLPDGPEEFPSRVRKEITDLRWERTGDVM